MARETKITVSADGRRNNNSEEHISISLINLATKLSREKLISPIKCSIAVKELIIEWEDYQTEACCYVQCDGINSQRDNELDIKGWSTNANHQKYREADVLGG